jgi:enoyl-CoA hydratase/carnithine racemase
MSEMGAVVRHERVGSTLVVTMDDPDHHNAYDGTTLKALAAAFIELDADPELRVGVLTGAGDRAFCSGADVSAVTTGGFDDPPYPELAEGLAAKPIIAAIEGLCLGGGIMIACGCDLRIAGDSASFGLPEARWNYPAQWLGALARQVLPAHALELALLGDLRVDATRMLQMGWLNRVVPAGTALDAALEWAERLGRLAPGAVRRFKELVLLGTWAAPEVALEMGHQHARELMGMEDTLEGARAFAEGRPPEFRGG